MDMIINACASMSGLWKKVASVLPLLLGAGSLLAGLGGLFTEFGHAGNAAALLSLAQNLQKDPNMGLILAGLGALGIHSNHVENKAAVADVKASVDAPAAPPAP